MGHEDKLKALGQMGRRDVELALRNGMPPTHIPIACDIFYNIAGMERGSFLGMSESAKLSFILDAENAITSLRKAQFGYCEKCREPRPETGLTMTCKCGGNWVAPKWTQDL